MSPSLITRPVRFSPETLAEVDRLAKTAGITPSAFIRATVDKEIGRPDPLSSPVAQLAALVDRLERLATVACPPQHTDGHDAERAFDDALESGLDELQL